MTPASDAAASAAAVRRVRLRARLAAALAALAAWRWGGLDWLAGALWGGALVEANLSLLARALDKAPAWRGASLKGTLTVFFLAFAVTAALAVLVVVNRWGHPLAFLLGLLSLFVGLIMALPGSGRPGRPEPSETEPGRDP